MIKPTIGVDVDDLRRPIKDAIQTASQMQFRAIEMPATRDDLSPDQLSGSGRRHLLKYVGGFGLSVAAVGADVPNTRFTDPATVQQRLDKTTKILELARDLSVPIVTASLGRFSDPQTGEISSLAVEAMRDVAERAERLGCVYAIRPSSDSVDAIGKLLDDVGYSSLRLGLDPAAVVMSGSNPMDIIERFADRILLSHVRDGMVGRQDHAGQETRIGEGEVDLLGVLASLSAGAYSGPHIIRRLHSQTPVEDIAHARDSIQRYLPVVG